MTFEQTEIRACLPNYEMISNKVCPLVIKISRILLFRHPSAGVQLVKGTIQPNETSISAAIRELKEESGLSCESIPISLGIWDAEFEDQIWEFFLCSFEGDLFETWEHITEDDHGHTFKFFWHDLHKKSESHCHPVYQRALVEIQKRNNLQ